MNFPLMTLAEVSAIADLELRERLRRGRWGSWRVLKSKGILLYEPHRRYEITLQCLESMGPLHWLAHLRHKLWLERGDVEDLLRLFDDLFGPSWMWEEVQGRRGPGHEKVKLRLNLK